MRWTRFAIPLVATVLLAFSQVVDATSPEAPACKDITGVMFFNGANSPLQDHPSRQSGIPVETTITVSLTILDQELVGKEITFSSHNPWLELPTNISDGGDVRKLNNDNWELVWETNDGQVSFQTRIKESNVREGRAKGSLMTVTADVEGGKCSAKWEIFGLPHEVPTPTPTSTATRTSTVTRTVTPSSTPSVTPTATLTSTPKVTVTSTPSPTGTIATATNTPVVTLTPTGTREVTNTPTITPTGTVVSSPTATNTPPSTGTIPPTAASTPHGPAPTKPPPPRPTEAPKFNESSAWCIVENNVDFAQFRVFNSGGGMHEVTYYWRLLGDYVETIDSGDLQLGRGKEWTPRWAFGRFSSLTLQIFKVDSRREIAGKPVLELTVESCLPSPAPPALTPTETPTSVVETTPSVTPTSTPVPPTPTKPPVAPPTPVKPPKVPRAGGGSSLAVGEIAQKSGLLALGTLGIFAWIVYQARRRIR